MLPDNVTFDLCFRMFRLLLNNRDYNCYNAGVTEVGALKMQDRKMTDKMSEVENAGLENNGLEFDGQEFDGQKNEEQQPRTNAVENHLEVTYLQRNGQCEKLKGSRRAILTINPEGRHMPRPTSRKRLCQLCNRFLEP